MGMSDLLRACFRTRFRVPRLRGSCGVRPAGRVNAELQTQSLAAQEAFQTGSQPQSCARAPSPARSGSEPPNRCYQSLRKFVPSVSRPSVRDGGEGRGEEALRNDDTARQGGAPLSPFVPHGARETDALLVVAISARTFATIVKSVF